MDPTLEQFLKNNKINYVVHEHKAVFTCEEAAIHCKDVPGLPCKNLFLKDKEAKDERRKYFLVIMPAKKRLQMKPLGKQLQLRHITFGKPNEMQEILKLDPGSVSPLGLMNDKDNITNVIVDKEVWDSGVVSFHPNINTASLELKQEDFHKLMNAFGNRFEIKELE